MSNPIHFVLNRTVPLGAGILVAILGAVTYSTPTAAQGLSFQLSQTISPGNTWESDYALGPGDRINIDIYGAEEYSGEVLVLPDGTVNLPRVGKVPVQGLTFQQATDLIGSRYAPYLRRIWVTVTPVALRTVRVGISGEVNRPGSYAITPEGSGNRDSEPPTLTVAIQLAGGITPNANLRQVQVRRPKGAGDHQTITVDLWDLLVTGDLSKDILLQGGDSVFIPTAKMMDPAEASQLATANFAPETIRVYVSGEVGRPGAIEVPPNTPLNQALLAAGGFNERAATRSVDLVRLNPDGTVARREVAVDFDQNINHENNPALHNQDVILVRRSGMAAFSDNASLFLGPVGRFLGDVLNVIRIFN